MFDNERFITKGISETISFVTQNLLWLMIEGFEGEHDYLQIFELSIENGKQKIIHSQEQPEYKKEYLLDLPKPITAKVYCIDDSDHSTMLLSSEY